MANQEPRLKTDIKRTQRQQTYSKLYFPELRSSIFAILSGQKDIYAELKVKHNDEIRLLHDEYFGTKQNDEIQHPIRLNFTEVGITLSLIKKPEGENDQPLELLYLRLTWQENEALLTIIAKALNQITLICTRKIFPLSSDPRFRGIYNIETNPLYEYYAIVYAMYSKLKLSETLPPCYIQILMAGEKITYNCLVEQIRYIVELPENIKAHFKGDIVKLHSYRTEQLDHEGQAYIREVSFMALFLIDFPGKRFTQKLQTQAGVRQVFENDRFINIESDATVV